MSIRSKVSQAIAVRSANAAAKKAAKKAVSKSNDPLVTSTFEGAGEPNLANMGVEQVNVSKSGNTVVHEYVDTTNTTIAKQASTIKNQAAQISALKAGSNSIASTAKKSTAGRILGTTAAVVGAGTAAYTGISLYNLYNSQGATPEEPDTPIGTPDWIIAPYEERNPEEGTTYYVGSDGYGDEGNTGYTDSGSIVEFIGNYGIYISIGIIILMIIVGSKKQNKTPAKKVSKK